MAGTTKNQPKMQENLISRKKLSFHRMWLWWLKGWCGSSFVVQ